MLNMFYFLIFSLALSLSNLLNGDGIKSLQQITQMVSK